MSKYAQIIDDFNVRNTELYTLFSYYYDDPVMTKTSSHNTNSIYAVKFKSGLMLDKKYLIVVVPDDLSPEGTKKKLSDIQWISIQARTLKDDLKSEQHSYTQKKTPPFTDKITLISRDEKNSVYKHETIKNIQISLLHTDKMQFMYPTTGTLSAALETFKTVIVIS